MNDECSNYVLTQSGFNLNGIHDSVGKALRTANQDHVTVNSQALPSSFHPLVLVTVCLLYWRKISMRRGKSSSFLFSHPSFNNSIPDVASLTETKRLPLFIGKTLNRSWLQPLLSRKRWFFQYVNRRQNCELCSLDEINQLPRNIRVPAIEDGKHAHKIKIFSLS
jgi:hypothetical protein